MEKESINVAGNRGGDEKIWLILFEQRLFFARRGDARPRLFDLTWRL
jgi:hypothetical protein